MYFLIKFGSICIESTEIKRTLSGNYRKNFDRVCLFVCSFCIKKSLNKNLCINGYSVTRKCMLNWSCHPERCMVRNVWVFCFYHFFVPSLTPVEWPNFGWSLFLRRFSICVRWKSGQFTFMAKQCHDSWRRIGSLLFLFYTRKTVNFHYKNDIHLKYNTRNK